MVMAARALTHPERSLIHATSLFPSQFALSGLASMGASGAIFGTHAAVGVDLVLHWSLIERPGRLLFALLFEIIVGIGLGYIPGIDNFSHIGGFAM